MKAEINIREATGSSLTREALLKDRMIRLTLSSENNPVENTKLINENIEKLSGLGGGTVLVPAGDYRFYTIVLKSNVNLCLEEGAVIHAAKTDVDIDYMGNRIVQTGEGGNYLEPEVNPYLGLQDHGHSFFANSLIYADNAENIMIYGKGLIDGSLLDEETGKREFVLLGADPEEPDKRNKSGHTGYWFGNKGIAFTNCKNVAFLDFSIVIGGHFAIITEGVTNLLVDHILIDTNRDALDIDCCQDVTITNSTFNSLTDDGIVVKASYGAGLFMPSKNILIEDCTVSGYDAGTVYAKTYTSNKVVADDQCGPTGRVKLGTESTCGYEQVTVRRIRFERSRGFALEAVDGAPLTDIIFEDCRMNNISSSPIFIRAGERGRFPVTGNSKDETFPAGTGNVRLDQTNWILPDNPNYRCYPARRFKPSYNKTKQVCIDGIHSFSIVDDKNPAKINEANIFHRDGQAFPMCYDQTTRSYQPDLNSPLAADYQLYHYANAIGAESPAKVSNILIRNVTVTDVDPRYPVLIMGLVDSPIENVVIENVSITYRGGITMEQAVEQRMVYTDHSFSQYGTAELKQSIPWQVNTFFLKNEGLLPRVDWDDTEKCWVDDPYNVPELPDSYPEPSNWGILPAYGLYARHVKGLCIRNVRLATEQFDERHVMVFDDAGDIALTNVEAANKNSKANTLALVTSHFRRPTNLEYVKEEPYITTDVDEIEIAGCNFDQINEVDIMAPAPGTPRDSLYDFPTTATPETGYSYKTSCKDYPLPETVYPQLINKNLH